MGHPLKPPRILRVLVLGLVAIAAEASAAGYDSLVEQGEFYLERGATYGADAVRVLEKAREVDPGRAVADGKLLSALARAYALTSRYSEAFWALQAWQGAGQLSPEGEVLRARLLTETGLGRLRVVSAVPLPQLTAQLKPAEGTRLDVASRKALDRLNELFARGLEAGPDGITLLVPEGRHQLTCAAPQLFAPKEPVLVEIWAGEEASLRLVPVHPQPASWKILPGARSADLSWPPLPGGTYELAREVDGRRDTVYRGEAPAYRDAGLEVGKAVRYHLRVLSPQGELLTVSSAAAQAQPAVSKVHVDATLESNLSVSIGWQLGAGTADKVRVIRLSQKQEKVVVEVRNPELARKGSASDGPFLPTAAVQRLRYRVEALVGDDQTAASGEAEVEVPPEVVSISEVGASISRGVVTVYWSAWPKDGVAQGYAVFRQEKDGGAAFEVGRTDDPRARAFEYEYEPSGPLDRILDLEHVVVPYVGDRYLLGPGDLQVRKKGSEERAPRDREPEQDGMRRRAGVGDLPDLTLSWNPAEDARGYEVQVDGQAYLLTRKDYLAYWYELKGLQSTVLPTARTVRVFAIGEDGKKVPVMELDVRYFRYPMALDKERAVLPGPRKAAGTE